MFTSRQPAGGRADNARRDRETGAVGELRAVAGELDGAPPAGGPPAPGWPGGRGRVAVRGWALSHPACPRPGQAEQTPARGASRRPTDKVRLSWRPGRGPAPPKVRVDGRRDDSVHPVGKATVFYSNNFFNSRRESLRQDRIQTVIRDIIYTP
jgi:hypothetical protein